MTHTLPRPVACIDGTVPDVARRLAWIDAALGGEAPESAWACPTDRCAKLLHELAERAEPTRWRAAIAAAPRPADGLIALLNAPMDFFDRLESAGALADFVALATCSPTYARFVRQVPEALISPEALVQACDAKLKRAAAEARDDASEVHEALRVRKRVRFVEIVLAELRAPRDVAAHAARISEAADEALADALRWAVAVERAADARLCVFGMGKLGTRELNLSSDVDVVFVHDPVSEGDGEASARVVRRVADAMERVTPHGLVFRVDLRLRPFGSQGAPSHTRAQLVSYLETHGRAWERGAWLKARVVAGDRDVGARTLAAMEPFRFPRSLGAEHLHAIAALKHRMVDAARAQRGGEGGTQADLKLEPGGIRHVEFFAQSFQLVFGSRDRELRYGATPDVLGKLVARGYVGERVADELLAAWTWLRAAEHRMQMVEERPTHAVPLEGEPAAAAAARLGFEDGDGMRASLAETRSRVLEETASLFTQAEDAPAVWVRLAIGGELEAAEEAAARRGFDETRSLVRAVKRLSEPPHPVMGSRAPHAEASAALALLEACADSGLPGRAARGVLEVLSRREARDVLFPILRDRPSAARVLALWFGAAPQLTRWVLRQPRVLNGVLTPSRLVTKGTDVVELLRDRVDRASPVGDQHPVGAKLHALARAKLDAEASLVLARLGNAVSPRELTARASAVAVGVLDVVVDLAFEVLGKRAGAARRERFGIVALGKLGARELAPGADVDVVFVYDDASEHVRDYARVAQRIVSTLSSATPFGRLYPADLRLRPDGSQGTVVTTLDGFSAYYAERAWPFERVAVGRASPVACSAALAAAAEERIAEARVVDIAPAREGVQRVRTMRLQEATSDDWKKCRCGLQDLELALQVATLEARRAGTPTANSWDAIEALRPRVGDARADEWKRALNVFRDVELWSRLSMGADTSLFPAELPSRRAVERRVAAGALRPFEDAWADAKAAADAALAVAGLDGV